MNTSPKFPSLPLPMPPGWLMHELQQKLVLLINHVLQQEPQAMQRLKRQKGQVVSMSYGKLSLQLVATPVGLVDLAGVDVEPALRLKVLDDNPLILAQILLRGDKPRMEISGDVMLAAEVNWLVDHVRWDVEEDLSRIMGDVPAHGLMQVLRGLRDVLGKFIQANPRRDSANASEESSHQP